MHSTIKYMRDKQLRSVSIESRLVPNPIAVKFVVIEHELGHISDVAPKDDGLFLDELLERMGIEILDVSPATDSDEPKPYTHRS